MQALAQLLPYGGSLNTLLNARAKEIATDRARVFFDKLNEGAVELTPAIIQSEDFIHRYVITAKAAMNTRRRAKIQLFAQMLKGSFVSDTLSDSDEYEECLRIFDELSYREFLTLTILKRFEERFPFDEPIPSNTDYRNEQEYKDIKRAEQFWNEFLSEVSQKLNVTLSETKDLLNRLTQSGCYQQIVVQLFFSEVREEGKLTLTFYKIAELVGNQMGEAD